MLFAYKQPAITSPELKPALVVYNHLIYIRMKQLLLLNFTGSSFYGTGAGSFGQKKKYIYPAKVNSDLLIDWPEMSIWKNKSENGALYLLYVLF